MDIATSARVKRWRVGCLYGGFAPRHTIALLHYVKANRCLHRTVVLLSILTEEVPVVHPTEQLVLRELARACGGGWHLRYMETPDVGALMDAFA